MSSEQTFDAGLVEQTKQQIRTLVGEITQLSKSDIPLEEFYSQFLQRVITAIAATGGVIWTFNDGGGLALQCQINLRETGLGADKEKMAEHSRLLYHALKHPEGMIVSPYSSSEEENGTMGNPTGNLVLLVPLLTEVELVGLVEIFQRPDSPANTQKGYLRFLLQMAELAIEFIRGEQLRHLADRQLLWNQIEEFSRTIHESLDPRQTAYTIANEGRRLIGCDRVSVAIRYGSRCRIEAVSGQDLFDKRSNTVRLLNKLATAVVSVEEPLWYTGDTTNLAPQVEKLVDAYVDESHSKAVVVIPLVPPMREEDKEDYKKRQDNRKKPLGALIVEQIENSAIQSRLRQRVEIVQKHGCVALENSLDHNSLFLMPLWRAIGRWGWVVKARTLPKTVLVLLILLALLVGLFVFPYKFEVESEGRLMPVLRHEIFATMDGDISEVLAHHGDVVQGPVYREGVKLDEKGRPIQVNLGEGDEMRVIDPSAIIQRYGTKLVTLRNIDLRTQIVKLNGDINRTRQELAAIEQMLSQERTLTQEDRIRQQGRCAELERLLEAYQAERFLLRIKQRNLDVYAPCDGIVITFDVREKLTNRPVQRGQVLMEVANPEGDWEVELFMPEKRIGLIREAQQRFAETYPEGLPVTYILASQPEKKWKGRIKEIHKTAEVRGEKGCTVLIKVAIDKNDIQPNIGATVSGKVYCGVKPIGYVWFYDLIAFVQQKILFRWL